MSLSNIICDEQAFDRIKPDLPSQDNAADPRLALPSVTLFATRDAPPAR